MRILEAGHNYELDSYKPKGSHLVYDQQKLAFFKKVGEEFPGNEGPQHSGTNCQEPLRVVIDRIEYLRMQALALNDWDSLQDDNRVLHLLRKAIQILEGRAARRAGKVLSLSVPELERIEKVPPCKVCGHIYPHEHV